MSSNMRVMYVESVAGFGGSLTALLELIRQLPADVDPLLVIPYDPRSFTKLPPRLKCEVIPHTHNDMYESCRSLRSYILLAKNITWWVLQLDRCVRRFRPHLIHANNMNIINIPCGIVGCCRRIPVISHQRDFEYPGRLNRFVLRILHDHHVAISKAVGRSLIDLGLEEERCSVVYDSIRIPAQDIERPSNKNDRPLVVAKYSMLVPCKGHEVFLRAISLVARRVDRPFRVVIVGDEPFGSTGYLERLKRLAAELGIAPIIQFAGFVKNVYEHMAGVDITVHASVVPEPLGLVVPEAMVCGAAVIATEGGGPSEIVQHDQTGLLVPRGDADAMADAIGRLLTYSDFRLWIAEQGRQYALSMFMDKKLSMNILNLYRRIIQKYI